MHNGAHVLIALFRNLGDLLLATPVFSVLHNRFPGIKIDVCVNQEGVELLNGNPYIHRIIALNRHNKIAKRISSEIALYGSILQTRYDLAINLTEGDRGALCTLLSRAPIRVGWDPKKSGFLGKKKIYTKIIEHCPHPRHTVEKHLDALRVLGIMPTPEERELFFPPSSEIRVQEQTNLVSKGYCVLHPVSRWHFKMLPFQTLVEIGKALQKRGEVIVITGGNNEFERDYTHKLHLAIAGSILLGGKLSIQESGQIIRNAKLLITPDSLALHIASATKTPVVTYFGPTSEKNWGPWQHPYARVITENVSCRPCYRPGCGGSGKSDCLEFISAAGIVAAAQELLSIQ